MKNIIRLLGSLVGLTLLGVAAISFVPGKAEAADAVCYSSLSLPVDAAEASDGVERAGMARPIPCSDDLIQGYLNVPVVNGGQTLAALQPDHCYVSGEFVLIELPPDQGDLTCANLAAWAQQTTTTPTKCYRYNADNFNKFNTAQFNVSALTESPCEGELNNAYKEKSGSDLPTGMCAVFSLKLDYLLTRCGDVQGTQANAQANQEENAIKATSGSCDITETEATCKVNTDQVVTDCKPGDKCDFMAEFINPAIRFLSVGVGFIIVIVVVASGIRYSAAGSDPQKAAEARKMAINALIALITYLFLYSILRWLLPKGLI